MATRIILIDVQDEQSTGLASYLSKHGLTTETWPGTPSVLQRLALSPPWLVLVHRRRVVARIDGRASAPRIEGMLEPFLEPVSV